MINKEIKDWKVIKGEVQAKGRGQTEYREEKTVVENVKYKPKRGEWENNIEKCSK